MIIELFSDIVSHIVMYAEEIKQQETVYDMDRGQLMAYVTALSVIRDVINDEDVLNCIGLNFDIVNRFLIVHT